MSAQTLLRFSTAGSVDDGRAPSSVACVAAARCRRPGCELARTTERRVQGLDLGSDDCPRPERSRASRSTSRIAISRLARANSSSPHSGTRAFTRNWLRRSTAALTIGSSREKSCSHNRGEAAVSSLLGIPHLVVAINKIKPSATRRKIERSRRFSGVIASSSSARSLRSVTALEAT